MGSGAAVNYLRGIGMDDVVDHERRLNALITKELSSVENLTMLGPEGPERRGGIFSFNLNGMHSHDIAMILDEMAGIMVRSGMHCVHPYFEAKKIDGCARSSFYLYNTEDEMKRFAEAVRYLSQKFAD